MRRFRFVGDPREYTEGSVERRRVYDSNEVIGDNEYRHTAIELYNQYPGDWEEVFEEAPLHQTDLGYYAGLAMNGLLTDHGFPIADIPKTSISIAKELIKQLKEECQDK